MKADAEEWLAAVSAAGYRSTGPRRVISELITQRDDHFTIAQLETAASRVRPRVGRATIFRTVELLVELGLLERLDLPSGEHAYVPCRQRHHHHVVCSRCGRSAAVGDRGLKSVLAAITKRTGYSVDRHRLEVFGVCPTCQGETTRGKPPSGR